MTEVRGEVKLNLQRFLVSYKSTNKNAQGPLMLNSAEPSSATNNTPKINTYESSDQNFEKKFVCPICFSQFNYEFGLKGHQKQHCGNNNSIITSVKHRPCVVNTGNAFNQMSNLKHEISDKFSKINTVKKVKNVPCDISSETQFESNQEKNSNPIERCKDYRIKKSKNSLKHKKIDIHVCKVCDKRFTSAKCFDDHFDTPTRSKLRTCILCSSTFLDDEYAQLHECTPNDTFAYYKSMSNYMCNLCHRRFQVAKSLIQHKRTHFKDDLCICIYCNKSFTSAYDLQQHSKLHTPESVKKVFVIVDLKTRQLISSSASSNYCNKNGKIIKTYVARCSDKKLKCDICPSHFKYKFGLMNHKKIHDRERDKNVTCEDVPYLQVKKEFQFNVESESVKVELKEEELDIPCDDFTGFPTTNEFNEAKYDFSAQLIDPKIEPETNENYEEQMQSSVTNASNSEPEDINTENPYLILDGLHKHEIYIKNELFLCDHCNETFTTTSQLKDHVNNSHTDKKPFICCVCQENFVYFHEYKQHQRTHKSTKIHRCSRCRREFVLATALRSHKCAAKSTKPHVCGACGRGFSLAYNLKVHQTTHTNEKRYKCSICHKQFDWRSLLNIHERIHTGRKPYVCNVCGKPFARLHNLNVHRNIHKGKKYKCPNCFKVFKTLKYSRKHISSCKIKLSKFRT